MNYQQHPTKKSTPKRMTRKWERSKVFIHNKKLSNAARNEARHGNDKQFSR